jgi:beta-glucosidase-like glycosyl hydrolase
VPAYNYHTEGLHGVRDSNVANFTNSTLFPQVTAMAATGNLSLVRQMGRVMAYELRAVNNAMRRRKSVVTRGGGLSLYGPTINIIRDGRWGRNQESVSEDPWLAGQYADRFIRGVQYGDEAESDHAYSKHKYLATAATCKHLAAYSQETNRHDSNANVSRLDMMETYLPQFEACIGAAPAQIMCSYNKINGVPACLSGDIQNGIVRDQWHFDGSIVSDCDAIKDVNVSQRTMTGPQATAAGIKSGCDQDCGNFYGLYAEDAVKQGLLRESDIDTALERTLLMRFRLGEFGAPVAPWSEIGPDAVGAQAHADLALRAAREAITLLRNDASILPLSLSTTLTATATATATTTTTTTTTLALIGPLADDAAVMEGSKQDYMAAHIVGVKEGIETFLKGHSSGMRVDYAPGLHTVKDADTSAAAYKIAVDKAVAADIAVLVVGIDGSVEAEAKDRPNVSLPGAQEQLLKDVAAGRSKKAKRKTEKGENGAGGNDGDADRGMIVVLINGGPISCDWLRDTTHNIAVVEAFEGGQSGGTALAETLFGANNPSGVLPYSLYAENATLENVVPFTRFDMRPNGSYPGRTYRFSTARTLWGFGEGLSYTRFQLQWNEERPRAASTTAAVHVGAATHTVKVTNTGLRAGAKVVQAFVTRVPNTRHTAMGAPSPPIKELFGMRKVFLRPGESAEVTFTTKSSAGARPFFTTFEDGSKALVPGEMVVTVGVGAERISTTWRMEGGVLWV